GPPPARRRYSCVPLRNCPSVPWAGPPHCRRFPAAHAGIRPKGGCSWGCSPRLWRCLRRDRDGSPSHQGCTKEPDAGHGTSQIPEKTQTLWTENRKPQQACPCEAGRKLFGPDSHARTAAAFAVQLCKFPLMTERTFFGRHYALAVVAIIFTALLAAAGLRSAPGVLMVPWGQAFGWSRQTISLAVAIGIFLFGLTG